MYLLTYYALYDASRIIYVFDRMRIRRYSRRVHMLESTDYHYEPNRRYRVIYIDGKSRLAMDTYNLYMLSATEYCIRIEKYIATNGMVSYSAMFDHSTDDDNFEVVLSHNVLHIYITPIRATIIYPRSNFEYLFDSYCKIGRAIYAPCTLLHGTRNYSEPIKNEFVHKLLYEL